MTPRFVTTTCLFCFAICSLCFAEDAVELSVQKKSQQTQKVDEKTKKEFFYAVSNCQHAKVEKLLKRFPKLILEKDHIVTAFMLAVRVSDPQTVKLFLKYGADPNFKDTNSLTPLQKTVDPDIAQVLIDHGADVNHKLNDGDTPIQSALFYGNVKLARLLHKNGAARDDLKSMVYIDLTDEAIKYIKLNPKKSKVDTEAFLAAATTGNLKVVQAFLDIGADPNQYVYVGGSTGYGPGPYFSPLGWAVGSEHYDVIELLLKNGADPNQKVFGVGSSALYMAVHNENIKIVKLLRKHGADVNKLNQSERDAPLHIAAFLGNLEIVKFLVENGADVNLKNEEGITPLEYALKQPAILKYLIEKKAKIDFFPAIVMRKTDIIKKLIADNPKLLTEEHPYTFLAPMFLAVKSGHIDVVKLFVSKGLKLNEKCTVNHPDDYPIEGSSVLHFAIYHDDIPMMKYIINQVFNIETVDDSGSTPLMVAVSENRTIAVTLLLQNGANVKTKDKDGDNAFDYFESGNLELLKLLLESKPDLNQKDSDGMTALMSASDEFPKIANYLIKQGATIDFRSACLLGLKDKVKEFLDKEPALVHVRQTGKQYEPISTFDEVVRRGDYDIFRLFLDRGRKVYPLKTHDEDPFKFAIESGNLKIVKDLVKLNGNFERELDPGNTPLDQAVQYKQLELVEYFLSNGLKSTARNSALHLAVSVGDLEIVMKLVESGMDVNAKDTFHTQPLHGAVSRGYTKIVRYLIKQGAQINFRTVRDETPLSLALRYQKSPHSILPFFENRDKYGYKPVIELLKKHGGKE